MEYTTLIDRILEAERAADQITDEVRDEQAGLEAHLASESQRIRDNLMARAKERLDKLAKDVESKKERELKAQQARLAETRDRMERAYVHYGDNWVDTLFRQTVDIP